MNNIKDRMIDSVNAMQNGVSVDNAIQSVNTGDEEFDLYYKACIYYNYQEYISCIQSLVELYHKYSKSDAHLFLYASCSLMQLGKLINNDIFLDICLVHSSLMSQYNNEQKDLLNQSIFSYLRQIIKTGHFPKPYIKRLLPELPKAILKMIPDKTNEVIPLPEFIDFDKLKDKTVINCYYNESYCGIGDFLRGSCYLFDTLEPHNISYEINFSNHFIGKYITSKSKLDIDKKNILDTELINKEFCTKSNYLDNTRYNIINVLNTSTSNIIALFTNYSNMLETCHSKTFSLSKSCMKFMQSNINFSRRIQKEVKSLLSSRNIKDYIVMHFRLGDASIAKSTINTTDINTKLYNVNFNSILNQIQNKYKDTGKTIIIMSDSNELKEYIINNISNECKNDIHVLHNKSEHSSNNPTHITQLTTNKKKKKDNMFFVALDMKLISIAKEIHCYSVYPWGSGFCVWLAKIYNIPLSINLLK